MVLMAFFLMILNSVHGSRLAAAADVDQSQFPVTAGTVPAYVPNHTGKTMQESNNKKCVLQHYILEKRNYREIKKKKKNNNRRKLL